MRARIRMASFEGTFGLLVGVTTAMGTAVVIYLGGRHIQSGLITLGDLVLVIVYLLQLYAPVQAIAKSVTTLQSSLASTRRALALLDEAPDVVERPHARPLVRAAGAVAFRNVSFAYAGHARVLHDLSFDVPPGTRLGIMGATGAGKTTLVSLLSRFYDPTAGEILLDGIDLREYRLQHLRRQFAIVLQEPVLFSATIAENIAYARPDASEQDIVESARSANAHDFIAGLSDGYQTLVGERGMRLSGGERQRIALARAFLKDAPILILDEPTSSIDVETEAVILEAMWRLMQGRTAFLIAHRITTLAPCDACLELEGGRLARMAPLKGVRHFPSPRIRERDHLDGEGLIDDPFGRDDPHAFRSAEEGVTVQGGRRFRSSSTSVAAPSVRPSWTVTGRRRSWAPRTQTVPVRAETVATGTGAWIAPSAEGGASRDSGDGRNRRAAFGTFSMSARLSVTMRTLALMPGRRTWRGSSMSISTL